jgi:hypothetical protein
LLAQLIDPAEVIFLDWYSAEGSGVDSTSGAMFALMHGNAIDIKWTDVPTDVRYMSRQMQPHYIEVTFRPLRKPPTIHLRVENVFTDVRVTPSGAVTLKGEGWDQALPFNKRYRQSLADYFQEIRIAVGAATTS